MEGHGKKMANIALFAETGISAIPLTVVRWLKVYLEQGHRFIVADTMRGDERFHKELSAIGAVDSTLLYSMDTPRSNSFGLPVRSFATSFDEENSSFTITASDNSIEPQTFTGVHKVEDIPLHSGWHGFRDKQMVNDSDMIIMITVSDTLSKRFQSIVQLANMCDKQIHIVQAY